MVIVFLDKSCTQQIYVLKSFELEMLPVTATRYQVTKRAKIKENNENEDNFIWFIYFICLLVHAFYLALWSECVLSSGPFPSK